MPKEAAPMPIGRPQSRTGHQQQVYSQGHQQAATYHHLQQYHHLPRPPGFEYYSTAPSYQNESQQSAQAPQSAVREAAGAYDHALKMSAKYDRVQYPGPQAAFKMTPYELHTPSSQPQTSVQHKTSHERTSHSTVAGYNRSGQSMGSVQYDHKMAAYNSVQPQALPYNRFSKKKLATHTPEKSSVRDYGVSRNEKKPPTSVYDRPVVPSTSYERLSKVTVSSPMDVDKGAQNLSYERHKAFRAASEYERRERHRRATDGAERAEVQYERQYEAPTPVSSAYERLAAPPLVHTVVSSYERQAPPTSSYERQTSVSAAYERRAVFDRAYEAAAYERRLFPPTSAFSSLNHVYYTANYSRGQERPGGEEFEAKDVTTSSIYPAKPRMSLLTSPEYLSSLSRRSQQMDDTSRSGQPSVIVPPSRSPADGSGPRKRAREGTRTEPLPLLTLETALTHSSKPDAERPSIYMPTVEPISPTSPPDAAGDDAADAGAGAAPKTSAKDYLLLDITRVDREINKIEHHIFNLKRKQVELEQKAKKSIKTEPSVEAVEVPLPQHFSLSHKVYSENRRRAKEAHAALSHLGPSVDLPLYNQPSDSAVYQDNRQKHLLFKGRLIAHLRRRRREKRCAEIRMTEDYGRRTESWNRLVEKMESSPERKRRDTENRELFEKTFPKIRKEREDRERFLRVGSRVKSDADLEEIMDNLHEQEMEVKKMRDYAAVPPMLLSAECRRCVYVNTNGLIEDFSSEYKDRRLVNVWTDGEKDIFREKYLTYPKNFGAIAAFLERKSVSDCVQYYYLSKKTENYKRLLKKSGHKNKSGRSRNKVAAPPVDTSLIGALHAPAIAPRFQRDYKPDVPPGATGASNAASGDAASTTADRAPSPAPQASQVPPPPEPPAQPVASNDSPSAPSSEAPPLPPPDVTAPRSAPTAPPPQSAPTVPPPRSAPTVPLPRAAPVSAAPPMLKPLILPFPDIPIVVIDDSDDSNSSSHFQYMRK